MKIDNVDLNKQVLVIAEIGNNHEGSYSLAEELIGLAIESGANAVKFQTIIPDKLVTKNDHKRMQQLKKFQLSYKEYSKLCSYARNAGIIFLSTPFDIESAKFLNSLVPAYKIASSDNNFYPLLRTVAETGKPILLSTGLTEYNELNETVAFIERCWDEYDLNGDLALLHCVSNYPTKASEANLLAIKFLADKFTYIIGYSDHTLGIEACILAVALGARIIEKHFTINKNYSDFQDHKLSADLKEMKELVARIDSTEEILGKYNKQITQTEKDIRILLRRSIAANKNLPVGHIIRYDDLIWVRPGTGVSVGKESSVIGRRIANEVHKGDLIMEENLER